MSTELITGATKHRTNNRGVILLALCLAALIINIDVTIVNVALPSLVRELGASTTSLQWVVDAYTLVFAALILAAGSVGDRIGRKGVLLAGLAIFGVGSLAGSLSHTAGELIAARAFMGIGAAAMFPSTLSILANVFTGRAERAKAIGLWGATTGVGVAVGPILGGWLLDHFWWGSIFLFMAPIAAAVAVLVVWTVPTSRDPATPPLDWTGLVLSCLGMGMLVFAIIQAPNWGWGSTSTLAAILAGVVILAAFVAVEARADQPMLDVGLFRNLRFTAASGSVTIAFFALTGFTFLITQYFQFVKNYTPLGTGVRLLPVAISLAVASVVGTRLAVSIGNKAVVAAGLSLFGIGLLWIAANNASTSYLVIAAQMIVGGGGVGLITAPATESILGVVPTEKAGVGSAVNDATRLFGSALGVAVIGSVAASLYSSRLSATMPHGLPQPLAAAAKNSLGSALEAAKGLQHVGQNTAAQHLAGSATGAFLHSFAGACIVAGLVSLLGALVAVAFLPTRPTAPHTAVEPAVEAEVETEVEPEVEPAAVAAAPVAQ